MIIDNDFKNWLYDHFEIDEAGVQAVSGIESHWAEILTNSSCYELVPDVVPAAIYAGADTIANAMLEALLVNDEFVDTLEELFEEYSEECSVLIEEQEVNE